jgi:four helix bundle protein
MKENLIREKSFQFALDIIALYKEMIKENEYVISKQLLRSGTSIGANIEEAQSGQSKKDFLSKMSIALKEARETKYWILLLEKSQLIKKDYSMYLTEIEELIKLLSSIVKSTKNNLENEKQLRE